MPPEPPPAVSELDWSPRQARELAGVAIDLWAELLDELPRLPVAPGESRVVVADAVALDVPDSPMGVEGVEAWLRRFLEHSAHVGHPGFLAYIVGSGTIPGAVADLFASATTPNASGWQFSPAAHEVERMLVRWLADLLGLPESAGGVLVAGGAIGNLVGLKLARDQVLGWDVRSRGLRDGPQPVVYASQEVHDTVARAVDMLGLGSDAIRAVPVDRELRMRVDALADLIAEDRATGRTPLAIAATAGTVGTGAVDPLDEIATVAERHALWLHVDAAYGGAAALTSDLRPLLAGIGRAGSVSVDAHKWLYTPSAACVVLARDERHLAESFSVQPTYVYEDAVRTGQGLNAAFVGPNFSRPFDALKLWLSLLLHGRDAYARRISHDAALARYLGELVESRPDVELVTPVSLSICCFRYRPPDLPERPDVDDYLDRLNRALLTDLQLDGRVFPSSATVHGRFVIRACIVNFRTEAPHLEELLEVVSELGTTLDADLRPDTLCA